MTDYTAVPATAAVFDLAEGVLFDDRAQLVRWVDIRAGRVVSGRLDGERIVDVAAIEIGQTAGAVALAEDGGLVVAAARGLTVVSPGGDVSIGPDLLGERRDVRLNDASVDPQGRLLVGSLSLGEETGAETLLRVSADGSVETLRTGVRLSNGIAFAPDGSAVYHVDTLAGTVARHSYGPGAFDLDEPWVTVLDDFTALPDGLTVDAVGTLWVAQWGGGCVQRYSLAGELLDVITVDASHASCPAFVGDALGVLAITTAQAELEAWDDSSGALFLAPVDARGLPPCRWAGSTTVPYWTEEKEAAS